MSAINHEDLAVGCGNQTAVNIAESERRYGEYVEKLKDAVLNQPQRLTLPYEVAFQPFDKERMAAAMEVAKLLANANEEDMLDDVERSTYHAALRTIEACLIPAAIIRMTENGVKPE